MKGAAKEFEMRGNEVAEAMVVAINHVVNARESANGLDRSVETIVGMISRFNGKDATNYWEAFKVEIPMRCLG